MKLEKEKENKDTVELGRITYYVATSCVNVLFSESKYKLGSKKINLENNSKRLRPIRGSVISRYFRVRLTSRGDRLTLPEFEDRLKVGQGNSKIAQDDSW